MYEVLANDSSIPAIEKLSILHSHPIWIINAYFDQLKDWDSVEELLRINNIPVAPHIVAWPGKSSVDEILNIGGEKLPIGSFSVLSNALPNDYPAIKDKRAGILRMLISQLLKFYLLSAR